MLAVMTGRNCHSGIMGLVMNDHWCRRMSAGSRSLKENLIFLKGFQMMSSPWVLNHTLGNRRIQYVEKKSGNVNQTERGRLDWHRPGILGQGLDFR